MTYWVHQILISRKIGAAGKLCWLNFIFLKFLEHSVFELSLLTFIIGDAQTPWCCHKRKSKNENLSKQTKIFFIKKNCILWKNCSYTYSWLFHGPLRRNDKMLQKSALFIPCDALSLTLVHFLKALTMYKLVGFGKTTW